MRILTLLSVLLLLSGCGKPTIDASNDEAMKASIDRMKQEMSPEEQKKFEDAATFLIMGEVDLKSIMKAAFRGEDFDTVQITAKARESLHGLTADQVIAEATRIREARRLKEITQVKSEISDLEIELAEMLREKERDQAIQSEIAEIELSKTKLYWKEPSKYSFSRDLSLELTVTNNLEIAVSRLYMTGTLSTPGRSVPWLVEDFNYNIAGGLEPGETQSWTLGPNEYSGGWRSTPKDRDDTVFTVIVRNADGPDEKKLFDINYDEAKFEKTSRKLQTLHESLAKLEDQTS